MTKPRILVLDIETKPSVVYTWGMWDVNVSPDQIIADGGILCVGAKWLDEKEAFLFSEWEHGQEVMLAQVHYLLNQADAVVTYNGDKFDLPKLMGAFLYQGFVAPAPPTSIDILKSVKKLGYSMNRLAYIGPFLGLGSKVKNEGFPLWKKVMSGDEKARKRMAKYCLQDVKLTEKLYKKILPFIRNHPHLGNTKSHECGACGSHHIHSRGYRRTKAFKIQRLQCQNCGSWSDGKREKA